METTITSTTITSTTRTIGRDELIKVVESRIKDITHVNAETLTNDPTKVVVRIDFESKPFFQIYTMLDYEFEHATPMLLQHGIDVRLNRTHKSGFVPFTGMLVTISLGSDAHPARIFHVTPRGFKCRQLCSIVISGSEADGSAAYRYDHFKNANAGTVWNCSRSKRDGLYRPHGSRQVVGLGYARKYHDPSF